MANNVAASGPDIGGYIYSGGNNLFGNLNGEAIVATRNTGRIVDEPSWGSSKTPVGDQGHAHVTPT